MTWADRVEQESSDTIAAVITDLQSGRVSDLGDRKMHREALGLFRLSNPTVVNATAIYQSLADNPHPVYIYEDHPCISPPWDQAAICYRNEHGNVIVMHANVSTTYPPWETAEPVDWERVRWTLHTFVWVGGRSGDGRPSPTYGPAHLWQFAIYDNGEPADLHWVSLTGNKLPMESWDMAHLVLLGALNFMNCRNVQLVDPGPDYDRGLLFGKLAGRFWANRLVPLGGSG
jgi:hypothetical protein